MNSKKVLLAVLRQKHFSKLNVSQGVEKEIDKGKEREKERERERERERVC
jgi:hypothetical protein